MIKFCTKFRNFITETYLDKGEFVVGRKFGLFKPDVSLNMDVRVKGEHARIQLSGDEWFIEPVGDRKDIYVDDEQIDYPTVITPNSNIRISQTELFFEQVAPMLDRMDWKSVKMGTQPVNVITDPLGEQLMIHTAVSADQKASAYFDVDAERNREMVATLGTLPLKLAEAPDEHVAGLIVLNRLINTISGAQRGALLIKADETGEFEIAASVPKGPPPYSKALTQRAFNEHCGFIWKILENDLITESIFHQSIASGMYTALLIDGEIIGALCIDNPTDTEAFSEEDLQFFMAAAQSTAAAIGNRRSQ
jgi:GAF domain-containing protein